MKSPNKYSVLSVSMGVGAVLLFATGANVIAATKVGKGTESEMLPFSKVDKDNNGVIDRAELTTVPGVDMSRADKDNDGTLGRQEYEAAMKALGRPGPTYGGKPPAEQSK